MASSPENLFNARLTSQIKKLGSRYKAMKFSDRFKIGVSDWIVWHEGLSVCLEAKAIKELPARAGSKVLLHPFEGAQLSFFREMDQVSISCWGVIARLDVRKMLVLPSQKIPESGNFTRREFEALYEHFPKFALDDAQGLLDLVFEMARSEMYSLLDAPADSTGLDT